MSDLNLIETVRAAIVGKIQIHGSELHDLVMAFHHGHRFADSHDTERVLDVLEGDGTLMRLDPAPTPSQRAFAGLVYSKQRYKNVVQGTSLAGLRTHFWYAVRAYWAWPTSWRGAVPLEGPKADERPTFSFCESVASSGLGTWCIRQLTVAGRKAGGGIDTPSLCGHVKAPYGWDMEVELTERHLFMNACKKCVEKYREIR